MWESVGEIAEREDLKYVEGRICIFRGVAMEGLTEKMAFLEHSF